MSKAANARAEHLRQADRRIALARKQVAEQERLIASQRLSAPERERAQHLLETMKKTLAAFEAHRAALARTVGETGGP